MALRTRLLTALCVITLIVGACADDDDAVVTTVPVAPPTTSAGPGSTLPETTTLPAPTTLATPVSTMPQVPTLADVWHARGDLTLYIGTAGPSVFLALDAEDRPITLFPADRDGPHGKPVPADHTSIVLAQCDDLTCNSVSEVTIATDAGWIDPMTLAMTADGRPVVGYATYPRGEGDEAPPGSGIIVCGDPDCATTSTAPVGADFRMASDGSLLVMRTAENEIDFERCSDVWCTESTALGELTAGASSHIIGFNLDADGYPIVARRIWAPDGYVDVTRCLDPMCADTETISLPRPSELPENAMESVAFDSRGRPVIVYSSPVLGVVTCSADDCTDVVYNTIGPAQGPEGSLRFAFTDDDRPVIAISAADRELENYRIDLVVCDDPACSTGTIATITDHGTIATATEIDADGYPIVAFVYWSKGETHVYRCSDPRCEEGARSFTRFTANSETEGRRAVGPPAQGWRQLDIDAGDGFLMDIFPAGDGLAAYGTYMCPGGECAVVGTSPDGFEWTWSKRAMSASFSAATAADDAVVLGGQRCTGPEDDMYCIPLFWSVADGTWTETEAPCDGCAGWIASLAAWSKGFVAFGITSDGGGTWLSPDGVAWTRVDITGLFGEYERFSTFVEIDGTLHAYGNSCEIVDDGDLCDGVLWTSDDGIEWTRDARLDGLDGFTPSGISEVLFGYILEGWLCPEPWRCPSSLMISADGLSWANVHPEDAPSDLERVTGFGDGIVAIGIFYDEFFGEEVRFVAESPDLEEWSYFEVPPEMGRFGVNGLAAIDGGVVGVGVDDDNEIAVWVWEP